MNNVGKKYDPGEEEGYNHKNAGCYVNPRAFLTYRPKEWSKGDENWRKLHEKRQSNNPVATNPIRAGDTKNKEKNHADVMEDNAGPPADKFYDFSD